MTGPRARRSDGVLGSLAGANTKRVLEIGAARGYSAIWIGLGLRQTGGKLTTIEFDPVRAKEAAEASKLKSDALLLQEAGCFCPCSGKDTRHPGKRRKESRPT